jgi:tetratricopeptide (TPR) repeat protein
MGKVLRGIVFFSLSLSLSMNSVFAEGYSPNPSRIVGIDDPDEPGDMLDEEHDHDHDHEFDDVDSDRDHERDLARCESLSSNPNQTRDLEPLHYCMDFYWHSPGYDVGFNKMIRLGYRVITLDRGDVETITTVAWLLYSKWVAFKIGSENAVPEDEGKMREALALLDRYSKYSENRSNPEYFLSAGHLLSPAARYYLPELYALVIEYFERADVLADTLKQKVRARLDIGHAYRLSKDAPRAIAAYERVLEVDPTNAVALRCIKELRGT